MKTRTEAAKELLLIYNSMETRKVKLTTLRRKIYKSGNVWRCCGAGYDYTI